MTSPLSIRSLALAAVAAALPVVFAPSTAIAQTSQAATTVTTSDPSSPSSQASSASSSTAASPTSTTAPQAATAPDAAQPDDERLPSPTEPEYRLVNLPTTLRLPVHRASFELTHRFNGNLREGSFGENASNLFGLDQGAAIGFEFRYAVAKHVEAAIYRTNIDKTIQLYSKIDAFHQKAGMPFSVSAVVSVEGTDNFHENYQPGIGVVISRSIATRLAVYAEPTYVGRTGVEAEVNMGTAFVGLGAKARVRQHMYLVAEVSPRVGGYAPGQPEFGFGLEERVGGHVFQLNFTNTSSTTLGQVARGGFPHTLFLGFNLARKF